MFYVLTDTAYCVQGFNNCTRTLAKSLAFPEATVRLW